MAEQSLPLTVFRLLSPSSRLSLRPARFSVAGGAFKSLLISKALPADIDIWVRRYKHNS